MWSNWGNAIHPLSPIGLVHDAPALGKLLARKYRVVLIDRLRARAKKADSTPAMQALTIGQALRLLPDHAGRFVKDTATLPLAPREFLANPSDLATLKGAVIEQVQRYREIGAPTTVISGDADKTVSTDIHSRAFAAAVAHAKLIVLEGVGHMVQQTAPELVIAEIGSMIAGIGSSRTGTVN